ncbi:MAG TPA: thioredoxin domain-containing protein [Pseudonocardiaceae bacterium]|nr:thioredoxin domain-containing protein [Pseudonocardiaceae bacterium]
MSGVEQAEDKRKQQATEVIAAARDGGGGNRMVIAGVAIIVVLAVVIGIAIFGQHRNKPADLPKAIPAAAAGPAYPVSLQGDAIVTGNPQAPVTVDIYEDFLCPHCARLEQMVHPRLAQAAADGKIKLVYHPVSILDRKSVPEGYSTMAAGAAYCAANAGVFPRFHDSLFAAQPAEEAPAYTVAQLQQLGTTLGAGPDFAKCVQAGAGQRVSTATDNADKYISGLRADHEFGTPSVLLNGAVVLNPFNTQWLDKALAGV